MKKINFGIFLTLISLWAVLETKTASAQTPTPTLTSNIITDIGNLPTTCLPHQGRMLPNLDTNDDGICHCPPEGMCTETITLDGIDFPKLPGHVRSVCCPPPSPCVMIQERCQNTYRCPGQPDVITPKPCNCYQAPPVNTGPRPTGDQGLCDGYDTETNTCLTEEQQIAKATLPPCPIPPTTTPPSQECEVNYYRYAVSQCADPTFIGTRVASYCTVFDSVTPNPAVTNLNTCLAGCQPILNAIRNVNKTAPVFQQINTFARENAEMPAQIALKSFVNCRTTCFNDNGLTALLPSSEQDLNTWINLELHDNVTDNDVNNGTSELNKLVNTLGVVVRPGQDPEIVILEHIDMNGFSSNPPDTRLTHFMAKTYGIGLNITFNQKNNVFSNFFDNTYFPDPSTGFSYLTNIRYPDLNLEDLQKVQDLAYRNGHSFNVGRYDFRVLKELSPTFTNLDTLMVEHGRLFIPPSSGGISCSHVENIGMCITTHGNNGTCASCLSPETKITMADDSTKPIKDLKIGDVVKTAYGKTAPITEVVNLKWPKLELYTINKGQLKLTADHPIMTQGGWRAINYDFRKDDSSFKRYGLNTVAPLKVGDVIKTETGDVPVTSIMPEMPIDNGETYNLKLEGAAKSFYANGILVKSQE